MCDYSLHNVKTRPAKVGDKLVIREFIDTLTQGFASPEDLNVAVCLLPGTELKTAIFRHINLANPMAHHDALEFPDGQIVLLTTLKPGQQATVLQLPATAVGSKLPQPLTRIPLPTTIS